ncbi:MAG: ELWxxDGT repeat protein [Chloroflexota bacterium]
MTLTTFRLWGCFRMSIGRLLITLVFVTASLLALSPNTAFTQTSLPVQLTDIPAFGKPSFPKNFVEMDGQLFFTAVVEGEYSLWRSDGSAVGTVKIHDLPGEPHRLTVIDDLLYFHVHLLEMADEIWRSDGTAQGTNQVAQISDVWRIDAFVQVNEHLFIFSHGKLWSRDGTSDDTVLLVNEEVGRSHVVMDNTLYFVANRSELWQSDGTVAGTKQVVRIGDGDHSNELRNLKLANDRFYFAADDVIHGYELWQSDGTADGTTMVKDIHSGEASSLPTNFLYTDGILYFTADDGIHGWEIWQSDGTADGTSMVSDMQSAKSLSFTKLFRLDDELYAIVSIQGERTIWRIMGPSGEPQQIKSFGNNSIHLMQFTSDIFYILVDSGRIYSTPSLWKSDGTTAGTMQLADHVYPEENVKWISPDVMAYGHPPAVSVIQIADTLFWSLARDPHGVELWKSDLDFQNPLRLADINPSWYGPQLYPSWANQSFSAFHDSQLETVVTSGTKIYFGLKTSPQDALTLWVSDSTSAETVQLLNEPIEWLEVSTQDDNQVYIGTDSALWVSDGTVQGTTPLSDFTVNRILPAPSSSDVQFLVTDSVLWKSDGTPNGHTQVLIADSSESILDVLMAQQHVYTLMTTGGVSYQVALWSTTHNGTESTLLSEFVKIGGAVATLDEKLFFGVHSGIDRDESARGLWVSDGTIEGTIQLTEAFPEQMWLLDDTLFFTGETEEHGLELWQSDGRPEGTALVFDFAPGSSGSNPNIFGQIDDAVLLTSGSRIWKSDGTAAGTEALTEDLGFGRRHNTIPIAERNGTTYANIIYMATAAGHPGFLAIKSDGTRSGSGPLQAWGNQGLSDVLYINSGVVMDNAFYFSISNAGIDSTLWQHSDQSQVAAPLSQVQPGFTLEGGSIVATTNEYLYLMAPSGSNGRQLWHYRPQVPTALPIAGEPLDNRRIFLPVIAAK